MAFYHERIVPYLIALAMRQRNLVEYRRRVVSAARGRVLEIGIGSGLNIPFYGPGVGQILGVDPSSQLLAMSKRQHGARREKLTLIEARAEAIPLENCTVDTVVMTWTLCSVSHPSEVLNEIRRVLRPGGDLLFVEHGAAPDPGVARWQDRLTPLWKRISGGCHLNRDTALLLSSAGFDVPELRRGYMRGPRPFTFMTEGRARPR
jgi:ubiquinone/menaquinone biosynthesis C-methylase UbiE